MSRTFAVVVVVVVDNLFFFFFSRGGGGEWWVLYQTAEVPLHSVRLTKTNTILWER